MSSPIGALKERYSVVIVGSGYGGSVLAARLAEDGIAGDSICLFERGLELHPGEYPDRLTEAARHIQVSTERWRFGSRTAMFDFRFGTDVNVLVGCGLGGGSLINAGVSLRAPARAFSKWPGLSPTDLDPHYARAEQTLKPEQYPQPSKLHKYRALSRSAVAIGSRAEAAPINVNFSATPAPATPPERIQPPCTSCGNCISGCNVGSKNTLLTNYLPIAHRLGVRIVTGATVRAVEPGRGDFDGKWLVYVDRSQSRTRRAPSSTIVADTVILAGGTLGTTEILMRSRELGLSLSDQLGKRFSANGDVLGFAFDARHPVDAIAGGTASVRRSAVGPCITGMIEHQHAKDGIVKTVLIQEGAIPSAIAPVVPLAVLGAAFKRGQWRLLRALRGPYAGALRRTLPYLVICPDDDAGQMEFSGDRVKVVWPDREGRPAYRVHDELLERAAKGLGAMLYRQPGVDGVASAMTTVHPLGGCVMADSASDGVVNAHCQVFKGATGQKVHRGLYVCDGSIIPVALGVNPLLTITALAERLASELKTARAGPTSPGPPAPTSTVSSP